MSGGVVAMRGVHPRAGTRSAASKRPAAARPHSQRGMAAVQVAEIQRSRLLAGALVAIEEHGYANATVALITARSRVSRRTFYELFENREACLLALLEDVIGFLAEELAAAGLEDVAWRERVRSGLWVILCFFDREPALARVLMSESSNGGKQALERRKEIYARLAAILDEGRGAGPRADECSSLTSEGLVGAAAGIVNGRLLHRDRKPMASLLGELMSMIVLPYLGAAAARRERARPLPAPPVAHGTRTASERLSLKCDPLAGIPIRLTYRTARVLEAIASQAGVSNRTVADRAGIHDQGQVSKLLARLERHGLAENAGDGHPKGEANAWSLTVRGQQVAQRLSVSPSVDRESEAA